MKKLNLTKEFLIKEYITNKKSTMQIAKEVGCWDSTIGRALKRNNIKPRTQSEARRLADLIGEKSSNWKDGICSKKYYCKECLKKGIKTEIWRTTALYGKGRCNSCAAKHNWKNSKFKQKTIQAILKSKNILITKPENQLNKLLNKILPKQYTFVGNGKLIVGGFCPDFVNKDHNKIIELFGCYWHKCAKCGFGNGRTKDIGRLKEYKKVGYKTLIIWEHELKNTDRIIKKIKNFYYEK